MDEVKKPTRTTVRSHHCKNGAKQTCTRQIASNLTPSKGARRGVYKTINVDAPLNITTTRSAPTETTTMQSRQSTQQEVDNPTTRPKHSPQLNADDPTTSLCEGDQPMECQSGGHFASISLTQQPRLASQRERDEEVPINNTTTRTAPINITTTRLRQPTQHNADGPTKSQYERDTPLECRIGGHFGSISLTQQPRLATQRERDEEVPINNTTTRTAPINITTTRLRQPTQHNADDPSQCERDTPIKYQSEGGHLGWISQTPQERRRSVDQHRDITTSSSQHHDSTTQPTQPSQCRLRRRIGVKEDRVLDVEVKKSFWVRYHRHSSEDCSTRVNETTTFQPNTW